VSTIKALLNGLGRVLFWFAFVAFMLAAIPHTAYFFRAWEPAVAPTDRQGGLFYWGVAYAIAISVDGMVIYLTRALTVLNRQGGKAFARGVAWLGIGLLSLLSWFVNWQYAVEFRGQMLSRVLGLSLGWWKMGDIDPILASMFQALIVFYSFISDKVHEARTEPREEDLAELRQRAAEADERARLQASINAAKQQQRAERTLGVLRLGRSVLGEIRSTPGEEEMLGRVLQFFREMPHLLEEHNAALADALLQQFLKVRKREEAQLWRMRAVAILTREAQEAGEHGGDGAESAALETERVAPGETEGSLVRGDGQGARQEARGGGTDREAGTEKQTDVIPQRKTAPERTAQAGGAKGAHVQEQTPQEVPSTSERDQPAGRRTLTVKEAAALTGYSEKYVRDLRKRGVLKTAPRNKQMILLSSVNALMQARQNQAQKRRIAPVAAEESA